MSDIAADLEQLAHDLTADDPAPWAQMCELGLDRVGVAEDQGGSGGDIADLIAVVDAFAYAGAITPLIDASVTAHLHAAQGATTGQGALAHAPETLTVEQSTLIGTIDGVPVSGTKQLVLFGADEALVVDLGAPGVRITPAATSMAGEELMTVLLDKAPYRRLSGGHARALWEQLELVELMAHAKAALDLTGAWIKQREQFGRPLIDLPAVAARLADMTVQMKLGEASLARVDIDDEARREHLLAAARLVVGQCVTGVARTAHQLHGAMGITSEYPLHRHTTAIWSRRDRARHRTAAQKTLTALALSGGEPVLWDDLTDRR